MGREQRKDSSTGSGSELMAAEPLEYKENWPEAQERLVAFWQHEIIDRACIAVTAPRERQIPVPEADTKTEMTNTKCWLARLNAKFRNTYYGGEAIPFKPNTLGYANFGGEPQFTTRDTVWIDPIIEDWDRDSFHFDPENSWYQCFLDIKRAEYEDSQGKYLPGPGSTLCPTEMLAIFRGYGTLCLDLLDHPDQVRATQRELFRAFKIITGEWMKIIHAAEDGMPVIGVWAPGIAIEVHSDFSCLISAKLYRDFVLPEILDLVQWGDVSLYHLDGPDALQHLPTLLSIEQLDCIQFTIGAGNWHLPVTHWLPLYQRIQGAGKLVHITARYEEVETLLEALDPRGIFIQTNAPSIQAAEDLLRNAERWSRSRT